MTRTVMLYLRRAASGFRHTMIIGIYGYQDAGKTRLVEELVRELVRKDYKVSTIKHTPHKKSIDCEGKDTWRHWSAGSDPVAFSSQVETSIIRHRNMPLDDIAKLMMREFHPDVLIIEGCKDGAFPKVALGKVEPRKGTVMVNPPVKRLLAYIDAEVAFERVMAELPGLDCGKCGLDCEGLARAILAGKRRVDDCKELPKMGVEIVVGGKRIATGKFVSSIVEDTVRGMLSSLKGYEPGKEVEIRLEAKKGATRRRTKT
jgi:molybdopterin-guanine dinucleotide biosynthesis protein B